MEEKQEQPEVSQYEKIIDNADKEIENLRQELDTREDEYNSFPEPPAKDNFFKFLREMLNAFDSRKIGNLSLSELGNLDNSVRRYLEMEKLCYALNRPTVGKYFADKAEIINATSMSKKATFLKLMVTKIRTSSSESQMVSPEKSGFSLFGNKNRSGGNDE